MKLPGGLSTKFALTVSVLIVVTAVALGWFMINHDISLISRGLVGRGVSLVRTLAHNLEYALQFTSEMQVSELIESVVKQEDVLYVVVQGPDRTVHASRRAAQLTEIPPLSAPRETVHDRRLGEKTKVFRLRWGQDDIYEIEYRLTTRGGSSPEEIALGVAGKEGTLGWARIGMSLALQPINESVNNIKRTITLVTSLVIVIAILAAVLLVKIIVRPLRDLAAGAQRIEKGELDMTVATKSRDEIGDLAVSFNRMAHAVRVREQDNVRLVRELEETNRNLAMTSQHKSQFLANMSHELRTPLNAIIGFSEILLNESEAAVPQELRQEFQGHIHDSGRHLLRLINDILDLSKVEAGRMTMERETVEVAATVEGVLSTVKPLASKKAITVTSEVDQSIGSIGADPAKLKQILYNLLSNAIKFTEERGQVGVRVTQEGGYLSFAVWDTGIGIPHDQQARIFEEFYQIQQTAGKEYPGTGLGLALAKKFVELHGGQISLTSEPGQGSTFTFTIPTSARPPEARPVEAVPGESGPLVLVIEDDDRTRELLKFSLTRGGYRVEEARDGEEALAKARELRPAIITLDILLPKRDGWDVLRALKDDPLTRETPVVIVSIVDDQQRGYSLGAADYVLKPFSREDLLQRLASFGFSATIRAQGVKALLVVDEPELMANVAGMLESAGFHTLRAQSPRDGLALAADAHPDVIVLNLVINNDMSGFEMMRRLKANELTKEIPVFVVTARTLDEADKLALHSLAVEVIEKAAFSTEDLLGEIRLLMRLRGLRVDASRGR